MQFETLFLDKTAQLKFAMLRALSNSAARSFTIADLSDKVCLSYQRTYNLFQELLDDFAILTSQSPATLRKAAMSGHPPVTLDAYRLYLLHNAIAFEFFDYLVQGHQPNTDRFCREHFVSRSTLSRKTSPLRRFLMGYGLKLATTSATLTGGEAQIRLCLLAIYWHATHGSTWPFIAIDHGELIQQVAALPKQHDPLTHQRLMYLLAICRLRIAQDQHLNSSTPSQLEAPGYLPAKSFPQLSNTQLAAENQFIAWYQADTFRFAPTSLPAPLQAATPIASKVTTGVLSCLANCDEPGLDRLATQPTFRQNLLRATINFTRLQSNYVKFSDFNSPHLNPSRLNALHHQLMKFLATLPHTATYAVFHNERNAYDQVVAFLAAPYLQTATLGDTVNVAIQLDVNNILHRGLFDFLDNLNFVRRLPASVSLGHCDLLITEADSQLEPANADFSRTHPDATLTWYLDVTEADFHHLYQILCRLYRQKLNPDA